MVLVVRYFLNAFVFLFCVINEPVNVLDARMVPIYAKHSSYNDVTV